MTEFSYNAEKYKLIHHEETDRFLIERMNGDIIVPTTKKMRDAYAAFRESLDHSTASAIFTWEGVAYSAKIGSANVSVLDSDGEAVLQISDLYFSSLIMDKPLSTEFILRATEAYRAGESSVVFPIETQVMIAVETQNIKTDVYGNEHIETEIIMVPKLDDNGSPIYEMRDIEFQIHFRNETIYFQYESYK